MVMVNFRIRNLTQIHQIAVSSSSNYSCSFIMNS